MVFRGISGRTDFFNGRPDLTKRLRQASRQSTNISSLASNSTCAYLVQGSSDFGFSLVGPAKSVFALHSSRSSSVLEMGLYLMTGDQVKLSNSTELPQSVTKSIRSPVLTSIFSSFVETLLS